MGADNRRLVTAIARRPFIQVCLGIGAGGILVVLTFVGLFESTPTAIETVAMAVYVTMMLVVCLSACVVPIRRALRLEPSEVLRAD